MSTNTRSLSLLGPEAGDLAPVALSAADTVLPMGGSPLGVVLSPDGTRAYVAGSTSNTVTVLDTATDGVVATIPTGAGPRLFAFAPDGGRLYVSVAEDGLLSVIDTATNTITASVPVGTAPTGVSITPDGGHVYVANQGSDTVSVIDTATNTITATIAVGVLPTGVAVTPDGSRAYVGNILGDTLSVIDTATNTITATIPGGGGPSVVAITPDGTRAYVSNNFASTLSVIDTATNTITATIPVGVVPRFMTISQNGAHVYVANYGSNTASVIDTATNTLSGNLRVGQGPSGVAVTSDDSLLYVTNTDDNTLSVIPLTLVPREGSTAGGTLVTINGHNLANASAVHFGTTEATILTNTPTSITVATPAGAGAVPVTVTTPGGTGSLGYFIYFPPPQINSISPAEGSPDGGTAVITGFNLSGAIAVSIGPSPVTIQSATPTQLIVGTIFGQSPGTFPVIVTTPGGSADDLTYTYLPSPNINNVTPSAGPTTGGSLVTITGNGLTHTDTVTFDGIPASFSVISDTTISTIAPPHPANPGITIDVTTPCGQSSWTYSYEENPTL
ncbi:IPT/TIG domain-containing protein [Nocardia sp. NBC_01730]|uniref:IPT/TIG domain-containing protein n=1 Tax=Nocardia sp. NBC_01730 TaxID=2975998 RepID=UPI002E0D14A8|nr:IPT/TIG domain-containing protein [Nocardia sp. NBC_01730]